MYFRLRERIHAWLTVSLRVSAVEKGVSISFFTSSYKSHRAWSHRVSICCINIPRVNHSSVRVSTMNRLVQVDSRKRFPMHQASSMSQVAGFGRGSAYHEDLEQLPVDLERGENCPLQIDSTSWNSPESFTRFTRSCDSCFCDVSSCTIA